MLLDLSPLRRHCDFRLPFLGQLRGLPFSIVAGGWVGLAGVLLCVPLLPAFWRYRPDDDGASAVPSVT
jgi:hypothetical protein